MAAYAPWTVAPDFPIAGSARDKLGFALELTTRLAAPPLPQTWHGHLTDHYLELAADHFAAAPDRAQDERTAMIHCGGALQHFKLVLKNHHCFGRVELFPDLDHPTLAARVHPGFGGLRDAAEQQLVRGLGGFTPARLEYSGSGIFTLLTQTPPGERSWLEWVRSDQSRDRLLELLAHSEARPAVSPRRPAETLRPAPDGSWRAAGFTETTRPERWSRWRHPRAAASLSPASRRNISPPEHLDRSGTFAVLKTKTDDKHGWLATGQILARLLLQARTLGLTCTPHLEALRQPESRSELRTTIGHKGFTQVILQFAGLPREPALPPYPHLAATTTASSL